MSPCDWDAPSATISRLPYNTHTYPFDSAPPLGGRGGRELLLLVVRRSHCARSGCLPTNPIDRSTDGRLTAPCRLETWCGGTGGQSSVVSCWMGLEPFVSFRVMCSASPLCGACLLPTRSIVAGAVSQSWLPALPQQDRFRPPRNAEHEPIRLFRACTTQL